MKRHKAVERDIARERIEILFRLAREAFREDRELSKRYLALAKRIGMRARVQIPRELKLFVCKGCGSLLIPPENCRVRVRSDGNPRVVLTCLDCGRVKRFPMGRKGAMGPRERSPTADPSGYYGRSEGGDPGQERMRNNIYVGSPALEGKEEGELPTK
jgi:ribonuclease P protein subunit RPR2